MEKIIWTKYCGDPRRKEIYYMKYVEGGDLI